MLIFFCWLIQLFFTFICQFEIVKFGSSTHAWVSFSVSLVCSVMYLLLVILCVMHIDGISLRPGGKNVRPLLVCLSEYKAICPLSVQFSRCAFSSGPRCVSPWKCSSRSSCGSKARQFKGSPWRTGVKVSSERSLFLWTVKTRLAREAQMAPVAQEDIRFEDCDLGWQVSRIFPWAVQNFQNVCFGQTSSALLSTLPEGQNWQHKMSKGRSKQKHTLRWSSMCFPNADLWFSLALVGIWGIVRFDSVIWTWFENSQLCTNRLRQFRLKVTSESKGS